MGRKKEHFSFFLHVLESSIDRKESVCTSNCIDILVPLLGTSGYEKAANFLHRLLHFSRYSTLIGHKTLCNSTTTLPSIIDWPLATRFFTSRFFSSKKKRVTRTRSLLSFDRKSFNGKEDIREFATRIYSTAVHDRLPVLHFLLRGPFVRPWASTSTTLDVKNEPCKNRRV